MLYYWTLAQYDYIMCNTIILSPLIDLIMYDRPTRNRSNIKPFIPAVLVRGLHFSAMFTRFPETLLVKNTSTAKVYRHNLRKSPAGPTLGVLNLCSSDL